MLPAPKTDRLSLADVLTSCLASLSGSGNRMSLPRSDRAVVVLVDGLGAAALRARAGHARTLSAALGSSSVIDSGFPTTTASALATLTTGVHPGAHGLVGYTALDAANDRIVNQLTGWDDLINPATWQPVPTVFERAGADGFQAVAVGPERFRGSGFSQAVLRGAVYRAGATIADRFEVAKAWLREPGAAGILYLYVPELDIVAHSHGIDSGEWTERLEIVDAAMHELLSALRPSHGVILTADHGVIDIPRSAHVFFPADPTLLDGVRFVAGEPRCLQLHFEPDLGSTATKRLVERWRDSESDRAWVATRSEAIAANWFGEVRSEVLPRIGDLIVAARKRVAYYDDSAESERGRTMIGQHGSWSQEELQVPLLRFGAFGP